MDKSLRSGKVNYWTGEECREFEREFASSLGVKHAIALMNGSAALELALRMWGVGPGDEVVVTPRTFIASVSCATLLGARPIFADVDRDSGNITVATIEPVLSLKTRAIIPVHLGGWPCEMDSIMELARSRGIKVLEDCAQATGAMYHDAAIGSFGDAAAFSFCQDKIITTGGEGGLLATDDDRLWSQAWAFKDHGKSYDAVYGRTHPPGFRWLHESLGTNWRMTELQGAIARKQLSKLSQWIERRRRNAEILLAGLESIPALRAPRPPAHCKHAHYRVYMYVNANRLRHDWNRDRIMAAVVQRGVPCFSGTCSEVYLEKAFDGNGYRPTDRLPVARELGESSLAFLVHPSLGDTHMHQTLNTVVDVMKLAAS